MGNVKSPSDTTIYAPVLKLTPDKQMSRNAKQCPVEQVVQYVCQIRLETNKTQPHPNHENTEISDQGPSQHEPANVGEMVVEELQQIEVNWREKARETANNMIVEAEQMKARLEIPQGIPHCSYTDQMDDEFFHITCHVEAGLRSKIERGEYVDLEKLLLKDKPFARAAPDSRMGLFTKDGVTYFAPAGDREVKISNVRKWEQAFRVYTAIYSKANPSRASEIWQYVHIINSAAATYQWGNVAEYDYTFRQLMATYLTRSWAKTYLQGWNLIMCDLILKDSQFNASNNKGFNKDNICWLFNKGKCSDSNCPKEHRCSYCGKWGHSVQVCRKRKHNKLENTSDKSAPVTNNTVA